MSRITTLADFRARFPEFMDSTDTAVEDALDVAANVNNKTIHAYYIGAHVLVTEGLKNPGKIDGGVYPIAGGETIGQKTLSYQLPPIDSQLKAWLNLTEYGRRYLALIQGSPRANIAARIVE